MTINKVRLEDVLIKEKEQKNTLLHIVLLSITIVFLGLLVYLVPKKLHAHNLHFEQDNIINLNQWKINTLHTVSITDELEGKYTVDQNNIIKISNTLPQDESITSMLVRSSLASIKVYVEHEKIYEMGDDKTYFGKTLGSYWNIVPIDKKHLGKPFTIEFYFPYPKYNGNITEPVLGSKSACLYHVYNKNIFNILSNYLIVSASIIIMIIGIFVIFLIKESSIFFIGLFTLVCGLWLSTESRTLQLIVGNSFIITRGSYYLVPLAPVIFLMYLKSHLKTAKKNYFNALIYLFLSSIFIIFFLEYFNIYDSFQTSNIIFMILVIAIIYVLVFLHIEGIQHENKKAKKSFIALFIFFVFIFIEIINLIFFKENYLSIYLRIGIILYLSLLLINEIKNINNIIFEMKSSEYYKQLALYDYLTTGYNRIKYEKDIKEIEFKNNLYIAQFDTDNLKYVNDTFGHSDGDDLIIESYHCIVNSFGKFGNIYRTGGDEFTAIITDVDKRDLENMEHDLEDLIKISNQKFNYNLSISYGIEKYDARIDNSISDTYNRADKTMYKNKAKKKFSA